MIYEGYWVIRAVLRVDHECAWTCATCPVPSIVSKIVACTLSCLNTG